MCHTTQGLQLALLSLHGFHFSFLVYHQDMAISHFVELLGFPNVSRVMVNR